jgi:hypothetical protein
MQTISRKDYQIVWWIVGFVDGEGCFSVSRFQSPTAKSGWQVFPEFVVTQGAKSRRALVEIRQFFQCGHIYINRRKDNHKENLYRYCVRSVDDLTEKIIPFFQEYQLKTAKQNDFQKFAKKVQRIKTERKRR